MGAAVIFGAVNLSSSIAGYLGLIDNVNSNVKKLLHQSFVSAVQNLNYATTASGTNQMEYIRRARDLFIDAISVEENENLISSYVGLAMCQHLLGDFQNSSMTIERIKDVKLTLSEKSKAVSKIALKMSTGHLYLIYKALKGEYLSSGFPFYYDDYTKRTQKFEEYKQLALSVR